MKYFSILILLFALVSCNKNEIDLSITPYILEVPSHFPAMPVPEDNPMSVEGGEMGRRLFYDKRLSRDNTISCAVCHSLEAALAVPAQFSTGLDCNLGVRQSIALVNLGWQSAFFWDGRANTLEESIFHPVVHHL